MIIKTIEAKFRDINPKEFRGKTAQVTDYSELIEDNTIVTLNGKPLLIYIANLEEDLSRFQDVLDHVKYSTSYRSNGMLTTSRIFGYAPRNVVRNHPCRAVTMAAEQPTEHETVKKYAELADKYYSMFAPELASEHKKMTHENVLPEYRIGDSMFTSGIINHNNPLKYHFDAGNYKNVWSCMFAFKKDIEGGYLAVPEINMGFKCGNGSLTMFDGQGLLHGVTPIKKLSESAVRYTVVYYSLLQMWNCITPKDEISRLRHSRAELELRKKTHGLDKQP